MEKTISLCLIFVFACSIFVSGCISSTDTKPAATQTTIPGLTMTPTVTAAVEPTTMPAPTATVNPVTPSTNVVTGTPVATIPTAVPASDPIYTVSCTFTGLVLYSKDTVVTGISGNITNISTGGPVYGSVNSGTYQFSHVPAGSYDLVLDVQYTVYYSNNTTSDRNTRITDSFMVNGNIDKTYPLY